MSLFEIDSKPDSDELQGKDRIINYCALLKDLTHIKNFLNVDSIDKLGDELSLIRKSYNLELVGSLRSFISKVSLQLNEINDANKVHRIQRIKVLISKYYQMLETKIRELLYDGKDVVDEFLPDATNEKTIQVTLDDEHRPRESTVNSQLLYTNTSSIDTNILQDKIDKLEREKQQLLNSIKINNFTTESLRDKDSVVRPSF